MNVTQLSALLAAQQQVVEKIALGTSLKACLMSLCTLFDSLIASPDACSSIAFLEDGQLRHGAAPRMPGAYREAIDGIAIGPRVGSCGTAVYTKKQIIVTDIENDPLWADYKDDALRYNLKACWSSPVISSDNEVLGCFAVYYSHVKKPSVADLDLIARFTSFSGLAIEKFQSTQRNKKLAAQLMHSNEKFRAFSRVLCDFSLVFDNKGLVVDFYGADALLLDLPENLIGKQIDDILPAQKRQKITSVIAEALISDKVQIFEYETVNEYKHAAQKGRHTFEVRAVAIHHYLQDNPDKKHVLLQARDITRMKKALCVLQEKEERLSLATLSNGVGIWDWNLLTQELLWDDSMFALYHMRREDFSGADDAWTSSLHPDDLERGKRETQAALSGETPFDTEFRVRWPTGEVRHIKALAKVFRDPAGKAIRMLGTNIDISEIKKSQEELKLAANVIRHSGQSICTVDATGRIIDVNDNFTKITGYKREEALGQKPSILRSAYHPDDFYKSMWGSLLENGYWHGEIWNRRKNGEVYPGIITISVVRDDAGEVINYTGLLSDITQEKVQKERFEHLEHYDTLTELPNRVLLADRLYQAMENSQRRQRSLAVALLNLDGFKTINDKFGNEIGDQLLVIISQRIQNTLRDADMLARTGGDEFVVVLADIHEIKDCEPILERLLQAISSPVNDAGINTELRISASIGVTIFPQDSADTDRLIRHAYQAMCIAKQEGKGRYHLFDTALNDQLQWKHKSLQRIRRALQEDEFELYYQPKVNMKTGAVIGAEALIRWMHPLQGMIPPNDFLPVIENHAISLELDEWVINRALHQMSAWQLSGLNLSVSVNISALQLQQENFVMRLAQLLAAHPEVSPKSLQLEVLETSELSDVKNASKIMHACMELGVSFALDDFGTGYSSLTYLRQFPAKLIKIDQSFVREMLENPDDLAIIEGVIALAKSFKREVIAEGVETIAHGIELLQLGCDLAQGYGIAKPMPANALPNWAVSWQPDKRWRGYSHCPLEKVTQ